MTYTTNTRLGPEFTPDIIKNIIIATVSVSLFCALTNDIFRWLFSFSGPQEWFTLSWWSLTQFYLWKPISYLLIADNGMSGIHFDLLITLALQMYIIWVFGSYVLERTGKRSFLILYFGTGIFTGVFTVFIAKLLGYYPFLAGPAASIVAICVVWTMLNPESDILLFFLIPIKAKWLFTIILGAILLINLSQGHFINLTYYLSAISFAYFYCVIGWDLNSPFPQTHAFEDALNNFFKRGGKKGKIIDFGTGQEIDDDDKFVDEMLEKIAKNGEDSLSWREKRRMRKISERKSGL